MSPRQVEAMADIWREQVAATVQAEDVVGLLAAYQKTVCRMCDLVDLRFSEMIAEMSPDELLELTAGKPRWTFESFCLDVRVQWAAASPGQDPALPLTWDSPVPETCDLCRGPIETEFYDAHFQSGGAGCVCPQCFFECGRGLGPGRGQRYLLAIDDKFYCIGGAEGMPSEG